MSKYNLKTGDLLLFDINESGIMGIFNKAIKFFTKSKFSHMAVVLKDPTFIHPSLKGYYIWESSWEGRSDPQDGKIKLGVQITPFHEIYDKCKSENSLIYARRIECPPDIFNDTSLKTIHDVVYNKPYDLVPTDWINALTRDESGGPQTKRFWCSALVGYIYTQCGLLSKNTDWTILRPADFSTQYPDVLTWMNPYSLSKTEDRIL